MVRYSSGQHLHLHDEEKYQEPRPWNLNVIPRAFASFFEKAQAAPVEEDEKPADVESLRREAWMDDGMPMWPVYYT